MDEDADVVASACMVAPLRSTVRMGLVVVGVVYSYWQLQSRVVGLTRETVELYSP